MEGQNHCGIKLNEKLQTVSTALPTQVFFVPHEANSVNVLLAVLVPFPVCLAASRLSACESSFTHQGIPRPSFATKFKKNVRWLLPSVAPSSLSASSLHRSHSSCVPERSARLISARLCVSCRVSPKALLAPLAQAAVRFQTAWADGCLPNQSVLFSLISIFQTSIYFPLASQDQNSAELIIKALLSSAFILAQLLVFL